METVNHKEDKDAAIQRAKEHGGCVILSNGDYYSEEEGVFLRVWEQIIYPTEA